MDIEDLNAKFHSYILYSYGLYQGLLFFLFKVSEFDLQSGRYVNFRTKTARKGLNTIILLVAVQIY